MSEQRLIGEDELDAGSKEAARMKLAELERERVGLMEEMAEIAKEQKTRQSGIRRIERELKAELQSVEEHHVPEDNELTLADVERWCRTAFYNLAHTMPGNPHCYFARKKVRHPDMYERIVAYILEHGYPQRYGKTIYTVLDVRMNDGVWFVWPMNDDPTQSEVLNLKPDSMRPEGG
jgi:hypothetical protein